MLSFMVQGLSSRKVGATSINSKSSRSHVVFNCVIESWCKVNFNQSLTKNGMEWIFAGSISLVCSEISS